jgi:hypothetical protein
MASDGALVTPHRIIALRTGDRLHDGPVYRIFEVL